MSQGVILTNAGKNLLAKALTGKPLFFTRAAVGYGELGNRDPKTLTGLIAYKKELPIKSMNTTSSIGTAEIILEMTNQGLTQGFFVKEYGVFARDPDTNAEVLYSYRNMGSEAGYLEADNGMDIITYTLSIVMVIDQAPNVTAVITNTNQYVTISRLEQRVLDLYADYSAPAGFWSFINGDTQRIRPATIDQARIALFGTNDVQGLNGRIERLEDAVNQIKLNLEVLHGADDNYSHYMTEDFKDTSTIDMFTAGVKSITAGSDTVSISPLSGMIPGSFYIITDGLRIETVQVESINLKGGVQNVILKSSVKNNYLLKSTNIYRTSATISEQAAIGTSARKNISWEPGLTWKGFEDSMGISVDADMTLGNSKAFTLTGGAILSNSGLVSLSV